MRRCKIRAFLLVTLILSATFTANGAETEVVVALKNGRTVSGVIDSRSNDDELWLRNAEASVILRSGYRWSDVATAQVDDKSLTAQALRELVPEVASRRPDDIVLLTPGPRNLAAPVQRVQSLDIEAWPANFDRDVEDDGLLVYVYPRDAAGRIVPVAGRLELELYGQRVAGSRWNGQRIGGPRASTLMWRDAFPRLSRWSTGVRTNDFDPHGTAYKFPFRNFHPDFDLDVGFEGLVHARLVVPGQGAFDASDANVLLQRRSQFRDQIQHFTNTFPYRTNNSRFRPNARYLPSENANVRH